MAIFIPPATLPIHLFVHPESTTFTEGINNYTELINRDGTQGEYFLNRALFHQALGDWERAAADAKRALELGLAPMRQGVAHTVIGGQFYAAKNWQHAAASYTSALDDVGSPLNRLAQFGRACCLYAMHKYALCIEDASLSLTDQFRFEESLRLRASCYAHLLEWQDALADLDRLIQMNPSSAGAAAFEARGTAHTHLRSYAQALQDFNAAIAQDPSQAPYWVRRATCRVFLNDPDTDAVHADLQEAMRLNPSIAKSPDTWTALFFYYYKRREYHLALEALNHALHLDPQNIAALRQRAYFYMWQDSWEDAATNFEQLGDLTVLEAEDEFNLGECYCETDQPEEALSHLTRAIELGLEDNDLLLDALIMRSSCHQQLGDPQQACEDASRAMELQPDFVPAMIRRASCYMEMEEPQLAMEDLNRALELQPDHPEALIVRAAALSHIDEPDEALRNIDFAIELLGEEEDPYRLVWLITAYDQRAACHDSLGDFEQSAADMWKVEEYERLLKEYEDSKEDRSEGFETEDEFE